MPRGDANLMVLMDPMEMSTFTEMMFAPQLILIANPPGSNYLCEYYTKSTIPNGMIKWLPNYHGFLRRSHDFIRYRISIVKKQNFWSSFPQFNPSTG